GAVSNETNDPLANINIIYTGDNYGCTLDLKIDIGGKTFTPSGNEYLVEGLKQGNQPYSITGNIACPNLGTCGVNRSGYINIIPNQNYYVVWNTTEAGGCEIILSMDN